MPSAIVFSSYTVILQIELDSVVEMYVRLCADFCRIEHGGQVKDDCGGRA